MPGTPDNLRYHPGPGLEVGNLYPVQNARAFYEGMLAEGEDEVVTLVPVGLGRAASGTARCSGPATSTPPSRTCAGRSRPG